MKNKRDHPTAAPNHMSEREGVHNKICDTAERNDLCYRGLCNHRPRIYSFTTVVTVCETDAMDNEMLKLELKIRKERETLRSMFIYTKSYGKG